MRHKHDDRQPLLDKAMNKHCFPLLGGGTKVSSEFMLGHCVVVTVC